MQNNSQKQKPPLAPPTDYGPLEVECRRRGIGRTFAYELKNQGLIETFMLGGKRMVKIPSLASLPDRLPANDNARDTSGGL